MAAISRSGFHTFTGYGSRMLRPTANPHGPYDTFKIRLISGCGLVFIKDIHTASLASEDYAKLALVAHNGYHPYDVALYCLEKSGVDESPPIKHF